MKLRVFSFALWGITSLLITMPTARAQQGTPPTVRTIQVEFVGPQTVSKEKILANMRTRVGKPYSSQITEEDVRNLYATGDLSNVRIFGEPTADGVKVIVVVATKASISEVVIQGSTRVKASKLRDQISAKPGDALNDSSLNADRQKIVDYYQGKGYGDVDVRFHTEAGEKGKSRVIFDVTEGGKTKVAHVNFQGNAAASRKELLKVIKTKPKGLLTLFSSTAGKLSSDQVEEDRTAIRELLQSKGYIYAEVKQPTVTRNGEKVDVTFPITEGAQFHVGKVTYSGAQVFPQDELTRGAKLKSGAIYSPQALQADRKTISDLYGAKGYIEAQPGATPTPAGAGLVDVHFHIEEGVQYYVDRVNIAGNTRTKDKVIRRELALAPGDVFNTVRMDASKKRIENLRYFSKTEVRPAEPLISLPGRRDLNVDLVETGTGRFEFGAGFSSIDNLLGYVQFRESNFDLAGLFHGHVRGGGQKFNFRAQYGTRRKDFVIGLTEPYFLDQKLALGGELYYRDASYNSRVYDERRYGGDINLRKPINDFTSLRFEYRAENTDLHNFDPKASAEILAEKGARWKSQLSAELTYDTRDTVYLPHKGERIDFQTYVAGGFLGGDTDIYGIDLTGTKYFTLPWDTILSIEGQVAAVQTWSGGDRVPIYDRLYLGGQNNLRGFRYRDVSPKDSNNEPVGGKSLARFTVEYTFPIAESIRGAVFYDAGLVDKDAWKFSSKLNSDIGLGVLLELPFVGPMRLDYGFPLQSDGDSKSGKFNVNVGYKY